MAWDAAGNRRFFRSPPGFDMFSQFLGDYLVVKEGDGLTAYDLRQPMTKP